MVPNEETGKKKVRKKTVDKVEKAPAKSPLKFPAEELMYHIHLVSTTGSMSVVSFDTIEAVQKHIDSLRRGPTRAVCVFYGKPIARDEWDRPEGARRIIGTIGDSDDDDTLWSD